MHSTHIWFREKLETFSQSESLKERETGVFFSIKPEITTVAIGLVALDERKAQEAIDSKTPVPH